MSIVDENKNCGIERGSQGDEYCQLYLVLSLPNYLFLNKHKLYIYIAWTYYLNGNEWYK